MEKDILSKIKDFGLNSYEHKLWIALLEKGVSSAGELSDITDVPRSRTYDVLESLEKKGFIILKIGKPIKYFAVPPEEALERVKNKIKEDAKMKALLLEELKNSNVLDELNALHRQSSTIVEPSDLVEYQKGRQLIYNNIEGLIKNAKESVTIMTSSSGISRKKEILMHALSKNKDIDVKIACPITKHNIKDVKEISKFAKVRHTDNASRFIIVDNKKIVFMMLDDKTTNQAYETSVSAESKIFTQGIKSMFESGWENMTEIKDVKILGNDKK